MTTVALDGRGAERGAEVIVAGARAAAADGIAVRVFGDPDELGGARRRRRRRAGRGRRARSPTTTIRSAPCARAPTPRSCSRPPTSPRAAPTRSSAPGPTGATMTAALFALRRARTASAGRRSRCSCRARAATARRPCCSTSARTPRSGTGDLVQFAYLGSAFSAGRARGRAPRVALLSVGEEPKKGTHEVVDAHAELADGRARSTFAATSRAATCSATPPT